MQKVTAQSRIRPSPKERLSQFKAAAETIFSERGYDATTIREIALRSKCNLGLLSQNWGSKRELFSEIFRERLQHIFTAQMAGFRVLEKRAAQGHAVSVREILVCQLEPLFAASRHKHSESEATRLLFGRAVMDPSPEVEKIMDDLFSASARQFFALLGHAMGHLPPTELYWRLLCTVGAFTFAQTFAHRMVRFHQGAAKARAPDKISEKAMVAYVVNYITAGCYAEPAVVDQSLTR